jgi:hypothetical protein
VGLNVGSSTIRWQWFRPLWHPTRTRSTTSTPEVFQSHSGWNWLHHFGKIDRAGGNTKAEGINLSLVIKADHAVICPPAATPIDGPIVSASSRHGIASAAGLVLCGLYGVRYTVYPPPAVCRVADEISQFLHGWRDWVDATTVGPGVTV